MSQQIQTSLQKAFAARSQNFSNRSSCIFPVKFETPDSDMLIVFLNYWKIKNNNNFVQCNLRIYSHTGDLAALKSIRLSDDHYNISCRELLGPQNFYGMVEVEYISLENMRFTYPAVMGFYKSGHNISAVHSAGRIKNSDEKVEITESTETNFSCKFKKGEITPFFHVFNGMRKLAQPQEIHVSLFSEDNRALSSKMVKTEIQNPYSSQIIYGDEIFDLSGIEGEFYLRVTLPVSEVFPRFVCGNFYRKLDFYEVTHSFPVTSIEDYVPDHGINTKMLSFIPFIKSKNADLSLAIFPTNAEGVAAGKLRRMKFGDTALSESAADFTLNSGKQNGKLLTWSLADESFLECVEFWEGKTPSRLNTSYRYKVKGAQSPFSTDIATGAKSWVYPDKYSHWGHGVVGDGWETSVLIRNIAHDKSMKNPNKGTLTIYTESGAGKVIPFEVPPESAHEILISTKDIPSDAKKGQMFSWLIKAAHPGIETFWVSQAPDGRICGDHGF